MDGFKFYLSIIIYVFLFGQKRVFGAEIELKVRPGDNITLSCDLSLTRGLNIVWMKNSSHENQPPLIIDYWIVDKKSFQRFRFVYNPNSNSVDLHITNITVSDLGLYYCAEFERRVNDENGNVFPSDVFYYGNQRTRLSLAEQICRCAEHPSTISRPPVSNGGTCDTWLFSVCSVCVVLFSLLTAVGIYCLCHAQTTGSESEEMLTVNILKVDQSETHQCEKCSSGQFCLHTEVTYRLLPPAHP